MNKRVGLLVMAMALLLVGSVAYASIPDSQGAIHACRNAKSGALRVIDTDKGQTCTKDEVALNWETAPRPGTLYGTHIVEVSEQVPTDGTQHVVFVGCPIGEQAVSLTANVNDFPESIQGVVRPYTPASNWAGTLDPLPVRGFYVFVDAASSGYQPSVLLAELLCAKVS